MSRKRTKKTSDLESEASDSKCVEKDPANNYYLNREVCVRFWDENLEEYVIHTGVYRGVGNIGATEVIMLDQVDEEDPTVLFRRGFSMESFREIYLRYSKPT